MIAIAVPLSRPLLPPICTNAIMPQISAGIIVMPQVKIVSIPSTRAAIAVPAVLAGTTTD
jgi:hypothetical protein